MSEDAAVEEEWDIEGLVGQLLDGRRRARQEASKAIAGIARTNPREVAPFTGSLVEALSVPEAHTRWQVLDSLAAIAAATGEVPEGALEDAEASLFDEDSAIVRLAAFRFMAQAGSLSQDLSHQVWTALDESVQCYHGDPEYRDMLNALVTFANGDIAADVRESLVSRVSFDAQNGSGYLKTISQEIIDAAQR